MIWFCLVPVRISVVYLLFCLNPVPILIRCKLVGTTKPKHKACWKWKNKKKQTKFNDPRKMFINCALFNILLQDVFAKRLKLYFVCNLVASNELSINMPFLWNEKEIWPKSICSLFCMSFSSVWDSMAIKLAPNEAQMSWEWDKHVYCLRLI